MLFSEIYGSYFHVVSLALSEAVNETLTASRLEEIVREKAFAESMLSIPAALKGEDWPLLKEDFKTPLRHKPTMPLTTLQKRWMKALLLDPRIRLFDISDEGLEDVEPLYTQDIFVYFDRYTGGDPYEDASYREHFRSILTALREKRIVELSFQDSSDGSHTKICIPYRLEYCAKEDQFCVIALSERSTLTIPVAKIQGCMLKDPCTKEEYPLWQSPKETLILEVVDERKTLERALLHFSHLEKETLRLGKNHYRITLRYDKEDERELLNRIMSFGPMMRVLSPDSFVCLIRERLRKQKEFRSEMGEQNHKSEILCQQR